MMKNEILGTIIVSLVLVVTLWAVREYNREVIVVSRAHMHPERDVVASSSGMARESNRPRGVPVSVNPATQIDPGITPLSEPAKAVLGRLGDGRFSTRWEGIQLLRPPLPKLDFEYLVVFLQQHDLPEGFDPMQNRVLKNDLMNVLRLQTNKFDQVARIFMGVARDPAQDPVIREYALQHLSLLTDADEHVQADIRAFLLELADRGGNGLAGTSLLSLYRLAEEAEFEGADQILATARAMAADTNADVPSRLTALQVCVLFGDKQSLTVARTIVRQKTRSVPLTVSALSALGELGDPDDAALLERILVDADRPIRTAALGALEKITRRAHDG